MVKLGLMFRPEVTRWTVHPRALPNRAEAQSSGGNPLGFLVHLGVRAALGLVMALALAIGFGPGLPAAYNPFQPLDPLAAPNFLTAYKLDQATADPAGCLAVIGGLPDMRFAALQDRKVSEQCYIEGHLELRGLSQARMRPEPTSCGTALRLYMWERHALQPAAERWFGERVTDIADIGSYNCRRINTPSGPGNSMSSHATASSIDIAAVRLESGREMDLQYGWTAQSERERGFWRELRDGACDYFKTVLSPDFNALHADHFHLGQDRHGACR